MSNNVQVIDNLSGTILMETTIEDIAEAYSFAAKMEEVGLDIKIVAPGLGETLITSLGATHEDILEYKKGLDEEIESHEDDFGCAVCLPEKKS